MRTLYRLLFASMLPATAVLADGGKIVALRCGWLIDGGGSDPVAGRVIVIEGERIKDQADGRQ